MATGGDGTRGASEEEEWWQGWKEVMNGSMCNDRESTLASGNMQHEYVVPAYDFMPLPTSMLRRW
jgi:hypothetical protein